MLTLDELREAQNAPDAFLHKLADGLGPVAMRLLLARLRPVIELYIIEMGLTWADVKPAFELVDSYTELQQAIEEPEAFLSQLASATVGPAAKRMLVARLRPKMEPTLEKLALAWEDVLPALELVDTVEELLRAIEDVDGFLRDLAAVGGRAARRMAIARLRPSFEMGIAKLCLTWEDVLPVLEQVDTLEELQQALEDPDAFLAHLGAAAGPAARRFVIAKLRPKLEPLAIEMGLTWSDVLAVLELIDTPSELQAAANDPEAFFVRLATALGPAATRLVLAKLRAVVEPMVQRHDLTWSDVLPVFQKLTPPELARALSLGPDAFFREAAADAGPVGRRLLCARLRPSMEPSLRRIGVRWEDMLEVLELIDTPVELQSAFHDPEAFLASTAQLGLDVAKRMLLAKMRPRGSAARVREDTKMFCP